MVFHEQFFPASKRQEILANIERVLQPVTDFIRGNPIVSTAAIGIGTAGLVAAATTIRRRKKSKKRKKRKVSKRRKRRKSVRVRKKKRKKRRIIRGRGLGSKEIRHSGKGTKGKFKIVSFRDKRTGKMVRFKARK